MTRLREVAINATVIVCTAAMIAAALEFAVVPIVDDGMQYDLEMWKYASRVKRVSENAELGHAHRPNARARLMGVDVATNSLGLRDREIDSARKPGTTRILMLGDSITLGWGVPQDLTVSQRLDRALRPEGVEVINSGERHSKAYVYFSSRWDAAMRSTAGSGRQTDWKTYYRNLYDARANPGGWAGAEKAIERVAAFCRDNKIRFMIVDYPELRELRPYPFPDVPARLRALADRLGVPFVDLLPSVQNEPPASLWVTVPDPHPNARATELFAAALLAPLREAVAAVRARAGS